ncbi:MAG: IS3 family transposase [Lachnospiraceae bacterium]
MFSANSLYIRKPCAIFFYEKVVKWCEYIETFYNTVRIHSHCGYLSPNEYEEQYLKNLETDLTNLAS